MSTTMTISVEPQVKQRFDQLAEASGRSKSALANQAIKDYIDVNEWQMKEIEQAIIEADNGDFATDEEVKQLNQKWGFSAD